MGRIIRALRALMGGRGHAHHGGRHRPHSGGRRRGGGGLGRLLRRFLR